MSQTKNLALKINKKKLSPSKYFVLFLLLTKDYETLEDMTLETDTLIELLSDNYIIEISGIFSITEKGRNLISENEKSLDKIAEEIISLWILKSDDPKRISSKSAIVTLLKELLLENSEADISDIIPACKNYLESVMDSTYLLTIKRFIKANDNLDDSMLMSFILRNKLSNRKTTGSSNFTTL